MDRIRREVATDPVGVPAVRHHQVGGQAAGGAGIRHPLQQEGQRQQELTRTRDDQVGMGVEGVGDEARLGTALADDEEHLR